MDQNQNLPFNNRNAQELETQILEFWKTQKIVEFLRRKNKSGKPFYFLDGPPYTSGRIHLGHAWNKSLKDMVLRYKRLQGFDVWDRAGFDMHGLPTEHKVMARFDLHTKEDIKNFGYDKFSKECYKFCIEMMNAMIEDFERLGTTLDFSDPDQPIKAERIEQVWAFIKQAYDNQRIYLGKRALQWDPKDASALAKHELEYKSVTDTSIYVKLQDSKNPSTYYVIWTTTPWTIPLNLAIMVNPELEYVKVQLNAKEEQWIIAKSLVESVMQKAKLEQEEYQITETFAGSTLEGKSYIHPLNVKQYLPTQLQNNPKVYSILLTKEYVDDSAGTGLVHCAPGCGPEDYEVGHLNDIPPFNCVNESGFFEEFGEMSGWEARTDDAKFIEKINASGALIATQKYTHDYPHAERSKAPIIFRTTPQWFLKVRDLKETMLEDNEKVSWNPIAGKNAFKSWLSNLRDNSITKQRFWGTPIPLWQAEDGEILVIGSREELTQYAKNEVPQDLHKPWIDEVILEKNGKEFRRLPDVLDVWIDPGCQSWIMLETQENMQRYYPPNFIVEGKDQIRAWFNLLWICSHLHLDKPSFENVYMHGFVTDVDGVKMSKSIGNVISPYKVIDKHGADILRYYVIQASAGEDLNFSWDELIVKDRYTSIIWNLHNLVLNLAAELEVNPFTLNESELNFGVEEKFILSRLTSTIGHVTELFETYQLDKVVAELENLILELSRTYVQMVREKSSIGSVEERKVCLYTISQVLLQGLVMFQTVIPFISEAIYQNFKTAFELHEQSISHISWPTANKTLQNETLESQMDVASKVVQSALNAREKAKRSLRWPIKELVVVSTDPKVVEASEMLRELIKTQVNAKELSVLESLPGVTETLKPNYGPIGKEYGKLAPQIVAKLTTQSDATILSHIASQGSYKFELEGQEVIIGREHLLISRELPAEFIEVEFKGGIVYLSTLKTIELETEGFAREIMRQIQILRKDAGLSKKDSIVLHVQVPEDLTQGLAAFTKDIATKVGASRAKLEALPAARKHLHNASFKVKGKTFVASFDVE